MKIGSFLKLVEIQTKIASVTPFLLGSIYALYRFQKFNGPNFFIMLASLLCIDMATTTINNYLDYKKANKKHGFGYESHNAIVRDNLKESTVLTTIAILLVLAVAFGVILFVRTNIVVLLLGALSFAVGILYSFGPLPISRTPFGEIFSGSIMGLIIPFLAVYIHIYDQNILNLTLQSGQLVIRADLWELVCLLLLSFPAMTGIANIMLANNICDMDDDLENLRYTLPIYLGRQKALKVFSALYYAGYIAMVILVALRVLPILSALTVLTLIIVQKNINRFYALQTKKDTFALAVKNFALINACLILTLAAASLISWIFP